jgi:hypothetical protein
MHAEIILLSIAVIFATSPVRADPKVPKARQPGPEASCRIVEQAARANQLSVSVLTRLIWHESRFQVDAISRVGAQGMAQFMPGTSEERGLLDPFDPEQAISEAAKLLADLDRRFGNIGLAIAAYNAGPSRVASWLSSAGALPRETGVFVLAVTGRSAEEWAVSGRYVRPQPRAQLQSCPELRIILRKLRFNDADTYRGRILPGMEQSGRLLPTIRHSGWMLPGMEQSGRLLPSMRQSGRILPGMEQRGRILIDDG